MATADIDARTNETTTRRAKSPKVANSPVNYCLGCQRRPRGRSTPFVCDGCMARLDHEFCRPDFGPIETLADAIAAVAIGIDSEGTRQGSLDHFFQCWPEQARAMSFPDPVDLRPLTARIVEVMRDYRDPIVIINPPKTGSNAPFQVAWIVLQGDDGTPELEVKPASYLEVMRLKSDYWPVNGHYVAADGAMIPTRPDQFARWLEARGVAGDGSPPARQVTPAPTAPATVIITDAHSPAEPIPTPKPPQNLQPSTTPDGLKLVVPPIGPTDAAKDKPDPVRLAEERLETVLAELPENPDQWSEKQKRVVEVTRNNVEESKKKVEDHRKYMEMWMSPRDRMPRVPYN